MIRARGILNVHIFLGRTRSGPRVTYVFGTLASEVPAWSAAAGRGLAIDEPALFEVVRRHFDMNAVAQHGADAEAPHPTGRIGDHFVLIIEQDAEASVRQDLFDQALEGEQVFLRHSGVGEVGSRLLATIVGLDFVADTLVLGQRGHSGAFDRADMNEAVRTAALGRNETITLGSVEEFDCADRHKVFPFTKTKESLRQKKPEKP